MGQDPAHTERPRQTTTGGDPAWWERLLLWATGVGWGDVALLAWLAVAAKRIRAAFLLSLGRLRPNRAGHARGKRIVRSVM
jgi:hypothetical protein